MNKAKLKFMEKDGWFFMEKDGWFTYSPAPSLTCRLPQALNMVRS
jgi:hypothetical protein